MALAAAAPSREDFAALLEDSFTSGNLQEGNVIKGTVVGIEKDLAVIDVGLKTEGRVPLREFNGPGRQNDIKIGDTVEVYLERVENALGEAVLSRDKARREESWGKLEKAFQGNEKVTGVIFKQVKVGFTVDLDGAVAFLPQSQVDIRPIRDVTPLERFPAVPGLPMDRRRGNIVVSRRTVLESPGRATPGAGAEPRGRPIHRRGGQEHHRLRRLVDLGTTACCTSPTSHGGGSAILQVLNIGQQVKVNRQDQSRDPSHPSANGSSRSVAGHRGQVPGRRPLQGPRHQHHRLRHLRRAGTRDRGAYISEMSWTKKNVHQQDRLHLRRSKSGAGGRSVKRRIHARPQADHAQSLGSVRRAPTGQRGRGRGQEQTEFSLFLGLDSDDVTA
jgi:small subunit ribosomal protein S1